MKHLGLLFAGFLISGFCLTNFSCQKNTDCKATVTCVDSIGAAVPNAYVLLYALVKSPDGKTTYTADVTANGTTNSSGTVNFNFKLPAIYDIKATATIGTATVTGASIIKLEEGQTVQQTVTMK